MFRKSRRKPGRGPGTKQTGPRFVAVPDHCRRRMVVLRAPGTGFPRMAMLAVLAAITLSAAMLAGTMEAPNAADQEKHAAACPDANSVWEDVAAGDLETDLFETSTNRFVISHELLDLEPGGGPVPGLYAIIEDGRGQNVDSGRIPGPTPGGALMEHLKPNEGRYVVDAEPGSYRLHISPQMWDQRYALTVEECGVPSSGEA